LVEQLAGLTAEGRRMHVDVLGKFALAVIQIKEN
jgi:hypothetical protein